LYTVHGATISALSPALLSTIPSFLRYESIADVAFKKRNNLGYYNPSDVDRISIEAHLKDVPIGSRYGGADFMQMERFDVWLEPSDLVAMVPLVSSDLWADHAEKAFDEFSTQIPEQISIANFSWELREIGDLLPKISSSLTKTLSDGYLNFNFGWKPFVADLKTLYNLTSTLNARIQFLIARNGKQTRLGYTANDILDVNLSSYSWHNPQSGLEDVEFTLDLDGYRADFKAGAFILQDLKDLKSLAGYLRAMVPALGLTNPAKIIWNAIPFSFVADWFTGLSSRLHAIQSRPFEGIFDVSRMTTSVKETSSIRVTANIDYPSPVSNPVLGNIVITRYRRLSQLPVRSSFLSALTAPTPKQQSLLLALLRSGQH
jgi:hypothetical protein